MNRDKWRLVEDIFHNAVDRPLANRDDYLDNACGDDDEIRREVSALLRAENGRAGFGLALEAAVAAAGSSTDSDLSQDMVGRRIGAYRITGLTGQGGMGVVYRAVRDDEEYQKEVALKLLAQGLGGQYLQRRFREERQILACLDHPNIVRLLDGGTTQEGRPYLVMEHVDSGVPIDRFCREQHPSVRERVKLFRQVCEAVHYAHRNLIVHRDLKPAHMLIAPGSIVKLLDFGIAKIIEPDPIDSPAAVTAVRLLTPEYASPEQVRGEPITTASDVYSLGVVLYELLTEQRPYVVEGRSICEIERIISTEIPEQPSDVAARTAPLEMRKRISRELSGDLDNIILTALRKEPDQRYRSAAELADDIDRFLAARPVMARKHTWRYRAAKFVQRNRGPTCAAIAITVTFLAGIAATAYQARQADRRSQEMRKFAHTVLFDLHDLIEALPGSTKARLQMVQTALEYLDRLAGATENDHSLQLDLAAAYEWVSDAQGYPYGPNLGRYREALEIRVKAVRIYERLAKAGPNDAEVCYRLANSLLRMATIERFLGDVAPYSRTLHRAVEFATRASAADPANARNYHLLGTLQIELGNARMYAAKPVDAVSHYKAAAETASRWDATHSSLDSKRFLTSCRYSLSTTLWDTGDYDGFFREIREVIRFAEECVRSPKAGQGDRATLLVYRNTLGSRLKDWANFQGRQPTEAIEEFQKARALAEPMVRDDPSDAQARRNLATTYRRLALALQVIDPAQAEEWIRKALSLLEFDGSSSESGAASLLHEAYAHSALAEVLIRRNKPYEAVVALRQGIQRQQKAVQLAPGRTDLHVALHELHAQLGALLLHMGDTDHTLEQFQRSLAISEPAFRSSPSGNSRRDVAQSYENMANHSSAVGHRREACEWRRKSLSVWIHWNDNAPDSVFSEAKQNEAKEAVNACESELIHFKRH